MKIIEINRGFCRKPFECQYVPRATVTSLFVDITHLNPCPDEFWTYDYQTKQFSPPAEDAHDFQSLQYQERRWMDIRTQRDIFLQASDWTVLPDSPLSFFEKIKWKKYRQELRDLPQKNAKVNPTFVVVPPSPDNIIKPTFLQKLKIAIRTFFEEVKK